MSDDICEICDSPIPETPNAPQPWPEECQFATNWGDGVQFYEAHACPECGEALSMHCEEWCGCDAPPEFAESAGELQSSERMRLVCDCGHSVLVAYGNTSEIIDVHDLDCTCDDCGHEIEAGAEHSVIEYTRLEHDGVDGWCERYHTECLQAMRDEAETQREALALIQG